MKRIVVTLIMLVLVSGAFAQELAMYTKTANVPKPEMAVFSWIGTEFNFGQIKQGIPVTYEFRFTNTGEIPLVISTVSTPCGCTVTNYTKEPIEPGREGYVKATYDAARVGQFTKTVTVNANTSEGVARLTIKGEVVQ